MANPFTSVNVNNYNANPPSDDGAQTPSNRITWGKVTQKIGDPLKTAIETLNTNTLAAFGVVSGGVSVKDDDYTIVEADQCQLIVQTVDNKTFTLPSPADVGSPFRVNILNLSDTDLAIAPSSTETIDGESSLSVSSTGGVTLETDGSNWYSHGQNYAQAYDGPTDLVRQPEGYLTLTSNTPMITGDVSAATAIYYTPDIGGHIPISDGTNIEMREFSELTLSLSDSHTANSIYDVFLCEECGVIEVATGPAWSNSGAGTGARGTGSGTTELERWNGFLVNKNSIEVRNGGDTFTIAARTGIYIGSILMDGSNGQISCHRSYGQNRKWGVWNYYNRKEITLHVGDTTESWAYSSSTVRISRGQSGNRALVFLGLAEELPKATFKQRISIGNNEDGEIGVGVNGTDFSGFRGRASSGSSTAAQRVHTGEYVSDPFLGLNHFNCLERAFSGAITMLGTSSYMEMTVEYRG